MECDYGAAAESAKGKGLGNLAAAYSRISAAQASSGPPESRSGKPRLCLVFTTSNWCDGRLSRELAGQFSEYECRIVAGGDSSYLRFEDDLYFIRSLGRIPSNVPEWAKKRIVAMVQSDRPLELPGHYNKGNSAAIVVAQNRHLQERARALGLKNVSDQIIANGVNLEEFRPARSFPGQFTVGASGNFSSGYFDEWKGFSQYIVPACEMAGVKLKWCGWKGVCPGAPKVPGEHVPLGKMGEWYRGLSCLVSMSKSEGCSGAVFEAMATGLPVISTRVGWHGDVCSDELIWADRARGDSPEAVDRSVRSLAMRLRALRDSMSVCRALGEKARAFAEKWPHSRIADQWRPILESTLRSARGG